MKIEKLGNSETVLYKENATILFSYNTPVAAFIFGKGYVRTTTFHSVTTSKHINKWLGNNEAEKVDQETLNKLVE